jgi:iron complex outermembrane receptor protein
MNTPFQRKVLCRSLAAAVMAAAAGNAAAQIEEILVTAQKRAEDVQDVPISISAFSGDFMESSGIVNLQQLGDYAPNLTLSQSSSAVNNRIIMRGVGSVGDNAVEPSVAVFIDGVYYPRTGSLIGSLTDIEMVEILRGPQGTLFGRNASMGALNIRTRKPTEEFEGMIRGSLENYDTFRVAGHVGGAMTDNLAGRLSFQHSNRGGFGDNTFNGAGNDSEFGDWKDVTVRGKLYFTPTEDLEITLTTDYSHLKNESAAIEVKDDTVLLPQYAGIISAVLSPTGPFAPTGPVPEMLDGYDFKVNQDHRDTGDDEQWGIAADISWNVAGHTIRSITAYRDWRNDTFESALRLPADLFNRVSTFEAETISQEFQIISPSGGRFEYVAGLYYYDEDYSIDQNFDLGAQFCQPAVNNLVQANYAQAAIPQFAAVIAPLLGPLAGLAPNIAGGILTGAITSPAQLEALGVPAPVAAGIFANAPAPAAAVGGMAGAMCAAGPQVSAIDGEFRQDLSSIALFGQLTFHVTDDLRLTGGLRWTRDDKTGSFMQIINNPIVAPPSPTNPFGLALRAQETAPDLEFEDEEVTWLVNVAYDLTDDIMAFGSYSTGFKSGGFNSEGANRPFTLDERVFDSETVDNWEIGLKSSWFDNRVVANVTYFHTEIDNFQDRQFDGVNFFVQNVGELTQQGVELDVQMQPIEQLFAVIGVSYLDSEFDSFPNATAMPAVVAQVQAINRQRTAQGMPPLPVPGQDLTGKRAHFSPKWQLSLAAEWSDIIPNTRLSWFTRGEYQYISDQNIGAETNANPQSIQDGYDIVNARLGVRGQNDGWELSAFVRNAFDQEYCQTIFNQPIGTTLGLVDPVTLGGMQRCVLGTPRTYGIEAMFRF